MEIKSKELDGTMREKQGEFVLGKVILKNSQRRRFNLRAAFLKMRSLLVEWNFSERVRILRETKEIEAQKVKT